MIIMNSDAWFEQRFREAYSPTAKSAHAYITRMRALVNKTHGNFFAIMTQPDRWNTVICDEYTNVGTRRAMYTLILAAYKLLGAQTRVEHDAAHRRWLQLNKEAAVDHEELLLGEKSLRQKANWVTLAEIRAKVAELSKTDWNRVVKYSQEFVLLSIYATMPPCRNDLGAMKVYSVDPGKNDENYAVISKHGQSYLVFNRYKTAKRYGRVTSDIPPETARTIKGSLQHFPRQYLFVNRKGNRFADNRAYGLFVKSTFRCNFGGRAAGSSLLRHVYLTESDIWSDQLHPKERKEIHRRMMHSGEMASEYRKMRDGASGS